MEGGVGHSCQCSETQMHEQVLNLGLTACKVSSSTPVPPFPGLRCGQFIPRVLSGLWEHELHLSERETLDRLESDLFLE